uniref:Copper radical oxidase n=1 Tax=Psilocybe cubensis TaxID=181762 RepID=A0A8H7Y6W4_PSICU
MGLLPSSSLLLISLLSTAVGVLGGSATTLPAPGQPTRTGTIGGFELIGNSLVSAQQIFLATPDKVFFVDKVEGNPTQINGHPAWASEWALSSNNQRPMDALTNTFCAGGNVLGNGTWLNVGGNQAITYGGQPAASQTGGGAYDDPDGRQSIRLLTPCDDESCDWVLSPDQIDQRWYPTVETLEDGSAIILGGCRNGGYVNDARQDNPTYEFFPPKGDPILSPILQNTLPANLFPLTWLLPSGLLLIQSNWATVTLDYKSNTETPLDDIPDAVRVYPASAGNIMLPLTPANNYTATILFCGGSNVQPSQWTQKSFIVPSYPASASCVKITPDISGSYVQDDDLPIARSMANFIALPDGKILNLNGASMGTAGYGNDSWAIGHSYATSPVLTPAIYDPEAANGTRWSSDGLQASTVPRMYHSSATLLPDGSVMVSGSNPNPDYTVGPDVEYPTEYRTEIFYPPYYNKRRPQPKGLLSQYSYGGSSFDVVLDSDDLFGDVQNLNKTKVVIIRTGFSTHAMNMGQRYVELASSYTGFAANNTGVLHVSQLPPNPAIIAPGPAFIFVVVNGVPSVGQQVMLGSGSIGKQKKLTVADLPPTNIVQGSSAAGSSNQDSKNSAVSAYVTSGWLYALCCGVAILMASGL